MAEYSIRLNDYKGNGNFKKQTAQGCLAVCFFLTYVAFSLDRRENRCSYEMIFKVAIVREVNKRLQHNPDSCCKRLFFRNID